MILLGLLDLLPQTCVLFPAHLQEGQKCTTMGSHEKKDQPLPSDVHIVINDGLAILNITYVTRNHYGTYYVWTDNAYGGWKKDDLRFSLASTSNNHNNYLYHF